MKALVLMAPGVGWYMHEHALAEVKTPILLLIAEHDRITPRLQVERVMQYITNIPRVTYRIIENAGHFSFLSPFPPPMRNPNFPPSVDPEGFDREQFHEKLNAEVLDFLDNALRRAQKRN